MYLYFTKHHRMRRLVIVRQMDIVETVVHVPESSVAVAAATVAQRKIIRMDNGKYAWNAYPKNKPCYAKEFTNLSELIRRKTKKNFLHI